MDENLIPLYAMVKKIIHVEVFFIR